MTARRRLAVGSGRSAGRRLLSAVTDLMLVVIFVGLWLMVLTRGEVLPPWP